MPTTVLNKSEVFVFRCQFYSYKVDTHKSNLLKVAEVFLTGQRTQAEAAHDTEEAFKVL